MDKVWCEILAEVRVGAGMKEEARGRKAKYGVQISLTALSRQ